MGVVYSAYDDVMERSVAIKVMMADVQDDPEASVRFYREAHAAGQLVHRNIITIFDLGDEDGRPYIVMELLEGQTLGDYLKRLEGIHLEDKVSLMLQVCDGLRLAHGKGIFHRDIKPGNLFVTQNGDLKIVDFGIARLATSSMTMSGLIVGTPDYMSPEQACGREVDQRSDIFSAGAVFYYILTGRKPFAASDLPAVLMKVQNEDPLPFRESEASPALAAAVMKALAKSPAARYQAVGELMTDLNRISRELALETSRLGEQARLRFDDAERLAAERLALVRELNLSAASEGVGTVHEWIRQQSPSVGEWLDGGQADPLYRDAAQDVLRAVTSVRQSMEGELTALRQATTDLQAATAAADAGDWARAVQHFDAAATAVPACARARDEGNRLRQLIAEKRAADDRRRALVAQAKEAVTNSDWSAAIALADEVLGSERDHAEARALRDQAVAAQAAEARKRRQGCEQALARAQELARKGQYSEAERAIDEARTLDPQSASVQEVAELVRNARLDAERASELERRAVAAIAAARSTFGRGAHEQAIADLRSFLAQEAEAPGVTGALRELVDEAERFAAVERRHAEAAELAEKAETALAADDPDRALTLARGALHLQADNERARRIQGLATVRQRERQAAKERAEQAEQQLQKARAFLEKRKYATARENAQAAANLDPADGRAKALLASIDEAEVKARDEERRDREARQRNKAAAPVLALARAAETAQDLARAGWLAENALALDPECVEARQIIERAHAALSTEPELADDTVKMTGAANRTVDVEDTVTLMPVLSAWQRLTGLIRSWIPIGHREGA